MTWLVAVMLGAAPARELRVVLDCRWTSSTQCEWTQKALEGAVADEKLRVVDRVERLTPLENDLCPKGCPAVSDGDGRATPTLFVVPAHFVQDGLHLAFTSADGTVRSVLYLDDTAFDRYRRLAPSKDGAVVDLLKVTTGLWVVDAVTGAGGAVDDGVTWQVKAKVWRAIVRSIVQHGFSTRPAQVGRRVARDARWEVRLEAVELRDEGRAALWQAVAEAAVGRVLDDVLFRVEDLPTSTGALRFSVEFVNAAYGTGTRGFSELVDPSPPLTQPDLAFQLRTAVDGAHLMPRSDDLRVRATLQLVPRTKKK